MIQVPIDIHTLVAVTYTGVAVLCAVLFWFMPRLTRPDLYFAVTVSQAFRDGPEGKSILRRYRIELIVVCVLAFSLFVAGIVRFGVGFIAAGLLIELAAAFIPFYLARQRVLPHAAPPTMIREAELHRSNHVVPGGWIAASGPFILLAGFGAYLWIHGVPSDGSSGGQPGGFPIRSLIVYLLSTGAILVVQTLTLYGLTHWLRPVYAAGRERARESKFRRTVAAIVLTAEYYVTIQASWIILAPRHNGLLKVGLLPLVFVFVLVVIVVLARLGQGGSRMPTIDQRLSTTSTDPVGDRTPDRYWRLGVFYFNRDDSAVFVEKRFGLGYSLNFARPTAWIILLLILMAPLIPILAHLTRFLPRAGA